jgi:phosphatidylglycerophosphate synthase
VEIARPASIAELRSVTQPPEVRERRNAEHWTAHLYLRNLSPYLTWLLLKTPISANGVTVLMILTGWSAAVALLIPGVWGALLALALGQLQMLFDCSDGEVARWRRSSSPVGSFLDAVGHYSTEALIAIAIGVRAAAWPIETPEDFLWLMLGTALALVIVLNKALNDMVRVARASSGLSVTQDSAESAVPRSSVLARLRRIIRFIPFNRLFHSVEMTILVAFTAFLGVLFSMAGVDRLLLVLMLLTALLTIIGHFLAIVSSRRLSA